MNWAEISVSVSRENVDILALDFHDLGAAGVVIEDPKLIDSYIAAGEYDYSGLLRDAVGEGVTIKAYLPVDSELEDKLRQLTRRLTTWGGSYSYSEVREEDWADNWKQYFHPEKIGRLIVIKPAWEDYEASPDDIVVELDPGSAFGTGTHPSTALCLRELEEMIRGGMKVFDVGTGSGVLAIAASKLGADSVVATDNDGSSLKVAAANVKLNGLNNIAFYRSDLLKAVSGRADVIVANIIADVILTLLPTVSAYLKPGGKFLAGGIIAEKVPEVTATALNHGLKVERVTEEAGWAAMIIAPESCS